VNLFTFPLVRDFRRIPGRSKLSSGIGEGKSGMRRIYDAQLDAAIQEAFQADFESEYEVPVPKTQPPQPRPAGALARSLYTKYQAACKGRSILRVLRKPPLNPIDEALMLEDRIQRLPLLFEKLAILNQIRHISPGRYREVYERLVTALGYPPGVYLGRLDEALAQARCELAESRWRAVNPGRRLNP
jgi:hypothetical protein